MRTVTHGSHFGASDKASKTDPKIVSKSDAILATNLASFGPPFAGPKKRPKVKAKIMRIFDLIFDRFWLPKGSQNRVQNDFHKTLRTPTLAPKARSLVDFGSQEGPKMESLGPLWAQI